MSKIFWHFLGFNSAVLGSIFLVAAAALAAEVPANTELQVPKGLAIFPESILVTDAIPNTDSLEPMNDSSTDSMAQVTSVSQLSDVQPTDWAAQALQSLVERYGCIEGYPDRTYRGNRALTRYEFAAGLNACLDRMQELIAAATSNLPSAEDIATIRRLQAEFQAELATLRGRIEALEVRTAELEANQFSTTTKLSGEIIFTLAGVFGDDKANSNDDLEDNIIFADRVRLNFDSSFTGKDRLRTRLQARNITSFDSAVTGTNMTRLGVDGDDGNQFGLDDLYYRFPLGDKITVTLAGAATELNDLADTFNPLIESSASGGVSRFGRYNPIYRAGDGAGIGVVYKFSDRANLTLGYLAADAEDPTDKNGLFNGNYSALAQLALKPIKNVDIGLTYVHSYYVGRGNSGVNLTGSTGSLNARRPFGNVATTADSFGFETSWRVSPKFTIAGWFGYLLANSEVSNDDADIFNFAVTLAFPDLGKEGNLAGIVFGVPPKVTENSISANEDDDTSLHIEGFYRFQVSDNIAITPGVFVITNPEHNENNDTIFVGTIRTTFRF